MAEFISLNGQIVKGFEIKAILKQKYPNSNFVKVTKDTLLHKGFQYKIGENIDKYALRASFCACGGLYFTTFENMPQFMHYGNGYHVVDIDDNEDVFVEHGKFKAARIVLGEKILFTEASDDVIKRLLAINGVAIQYFSDKIRGSEEFASIAIKNSIYALGYCSKEIIKKHNN
jgi:hypothetical protein